MKHRSRISKGLGSFASAMLLTLMCASETVAAPQDLIIPCANFNYSYALQVNQPVLVNPEVIATSVPGNGNVFWSVVNGGGNLACGGGPLAWTCAGMTVTLPADDTTPVVSTTTTTVTGVGAASQQEDQLTITSTSEDGTQACQGTYLFHTTAPGGGWGDPHLTTVDGVHYDFQSAGEFTMLRGTELEIQTRQSPVPTATVPITNPYTGITHCVAIYTAVAAKFGSSRVSLQPITSDGKVDPNKMQLRVDGKPVTLGNTPLVLRDGGKVNATITQQADGVIDFTDGRSGAQLVVTPQFWNSQNVWYLNVNVYGTSADSGTIGKIGDGGEGDDDWLPYLPDGSSVGPKPESENERYEVLYEKFADAWRVTDSTSLFDYEQGTDTSTFTLQEWPRNHPQSCAIEGGPTPVPPATEAVAQQACANVTDANQKTDCVFDVMITGHTGFAQGYEIMQKFKPRGPGWFSPEPSTNGPPDCEGWKCWPWWYWVLIVLLIVLLIFFFLRRKSTP